MVQSVTSRDHDVHFSRRTVEAMKFGLALVLSGILKVCVEGEWKPKRLSKTKANFTHPQTPSLTREGASANKPKGESLKR